MKKIRYKDNNFRVQSCLLQARIQVSSLLIYHEKSLSREKNPMLTLVTSVKNSGYGCEQKSHFKCALLFYEYWLHINIFTYRIVSSNTKIFFIFFVKQQKNKLNFKKYLALYYEKSKVICTQMYYRLTFKSNFLDMHVVCLNSTKYFCCTLTLYNNR